MYLGVILFLLPFLTHGQPGFYVGYRDPDDQSLQHHFMFNRSIGVYHRRAPNDLKFCFAKPAGFHSMGQCKNYHAMCNHHQQLAVVMCPMGQLYRHEEGRCVDLVEEPRCQNIEYASDHQICKEDQERELVALRPCSHEYGVCNAGALFTLECAREEEAFSEEYGDCIPQYEHPHCMPRPIVEERETLESKPLSSMCSQEMETDYRIFFGPCNQKYMHCGHDGYAFVTQCEKGYVADVVGDDECVPVSESGMCPQNWDDQGRGDVRFVDQMNTILKAIQYCKSKQNGLYFDPSTECRREVIFCFKGQATFHLCPPGFDLHEDGWCKPNPACYQWQAPDLSGSKFLALLGSDARLCQRAEADTAQIYDICPNFYGFCDSGHFEIKICDSPHEMFDVQLNQCRLPNENDHCNLPEIVTPTNRCMDPSRESKLVATGKCMGEFLICFNGYETVIPCEKSDYAFHEVTERCIPKAAHPDCPDQIPTEPIPDPIPEVTSAPEKQGTCHGDGGFHVHEEDCTKFYRCAHGRLVEMSCPEATAFDPNINVCNHKHLVGRCQEQKREEDGKDYDEDNNYMY